MSGPMEWFPFYVNRFRHSRRVVRMTAQEVGAYVLLMCEQWDGGPIPDEDHLISRFAQCDISVARAVLGQCFELTPDGWVNPELLAVQEEQEEKREKYVKAGRAGGKAKAANRASDAKATPKHRPSSRVEESRKETTTSSHLDGFDEFWESYPKRKGSNPKKKAAESWKAAVKAGARKAEIVDGVKAYRRFCDSEGKTGTEFVAMASTWLNQARWNDDLDAEPKAGDDGRHVDLRAWDPAA